MGSYLKTFALMAFLTALLAGIAGFFGGAAWAIGALAVAAVLNVGAYWFSDRIVLRMYGAREVGPEQAPEVYGIVEELCREADLPMPTVAIAPTEQPNAFATGRSPQRAVVCVTRGILRVLDRDQLRGVLAHELGHVKNRDMLIGTVAATLSAAIVVLARFGFFFGASGRDRGPLGLVGGLLMLILAPLGAVLIQMAIGRTGEYRADRSGAELTGRPEDLAQALLALERGAEQHPIDVNPAAAHLCIVNPLRGDLVSGFGRLFRTHPPTEDRVRRLRSMAGRVGQPA